MEQRIDSNTKPEFAAGTDPAFIPGLTAPVAARTGAEAEAEKAAPEEVPEPEDAVVSAGPAIEDAREPEGAGDAEEPEDDTDSGTAADAEAGEEREGADGEDGPVFEVSDRRGSIRVDATGVRFTLDDQEAEFDWAEIGAVEVKTGRFGRRFTVTVHLSSRRWFNAEVEAEARSSLKEWTADLDAALDAHFEEG
ncbi:MULTISPECIES: hypothetical protein [unclassified Streptomyces]|uniref:hypothetical protein n=1 Tax=unclassified Streptomyces TaxID=2593676 RepID=UPI00093D2623|nr:hypothetical protein [Streptomyces sp. CB02058]OKI93647.1 hypothetical protein AMK10_14640 [Streptomyces sp. CB02058]